VPATSLLINGHELGDVCDRPLYGSQVERTHLVGRGVNINVGWLIQEKIVSLLWIGVGLVIYSLNY
jgi:hypothetical protein